VAPSKSLPVGRTPYQNQERSEAIHAGESCSGIDIQGELQCWAFRASTTTRLQHRETVATLHEPAQSIRARRREYDQRCKRCNMFHIASSLDMCLLHSSAMQVIVADMIAHSQVWPSAVSHHLPPHGPRVDHQRDPKDGAAIFSPSHSYSCHNLESKFQEAVCGIPTGTEALPQFRGATRRG
jgi:hypothetical protein